MYKVKINDLELSMKDKKTLAELIEKNLESTIIPNVVDILLNFDLYSIDVFLYENLETEIIVNPMYITDLVKCSSSLVDAVKLLSAIFNATVYIERPGSKDEVDDVKEIGYIEITSNKTTINIK